jgi:DNA-binding NarL/FixJ family response regulator
MRKRSLVFMVVTVAAWAELLYDHVRRDGLELVGVAANGQDALHHIERLDRPPDIVLVEVGVQSALETARVLRDREPTIRLVAVGLDDNPVDVLAWAKVGAIGLIARTASLDELLSALTSVARGEAPCSPAVTAALLRGVGGSNGAMTNEMSTERLTEREREVAGLVAEGFTNKEIAVHLNIEAGTVKSHVHSVIHKLGVSRRAQVAAKLGGVRPLV